MIVSREVVSEFLCSEVDEKIMVTRVIRGDVKEMFVGEVRIDRGMGGIGGKCHDEFSEDEDFLALGCRKFEIVLQKDDNPSGKFTINLSMTEKVLHEVGICYDFGSLKKYVTTQFLDCEDNCKGQFLFVIVFQGYP
jgi:hypothetical protein